MPVCVHCAYPAEHLYTTYKTRSNIRLGVCSKPRCEAFLDPLIEHPPLILLLDLILLKPRVSLHLLFNRGSTPLSAICPDDGPRSRKEAREAVLRDDMVRLVVLTVAAETIVRLLPRASVSSLGVGEISRTLMTVVAEFVAQHLVTLVLALAILRWRAWYPSRPEARSKATAERDGRQENFMPTLISLTLLYTSLLPLLLQLFLAIWYTPTSSAHEPLPTSPSISFVSTIPYRFLSHIPSDMLDVIREFECEIIGLWNESGRVWAGTRLLGGMSAGFGLRVLLPTKPWETTCLVLAGWMAATAVGRLLGEA